MSGRRGFMPAGFVAKRQSMDALDILRSHKKAVVEKWVEAVFSTYPLETIGFLRTRNDPFTNPVAHMTRQAASAIFDAVIGEHIEQDKIKAAVERFIKLRAVQKFSPGESMAVFYLMKPVLREVALPEMLSRGQIDAWLEMESRLDTIGLLAFDIYVNARDTLAEARIKEIKNQHSQLAKWAQRLERN